MDPEPEMVCPPGAAITVQAPLVGRPLRFTVPVFVAHVGWAIAPTIGAAGLTGLLIKMVLEFAEVQPLELEVTVNEYEFTAKFEITTDVPIPDTVVEVAGLEPIIVTVHPPELGKLTRVTEPVARIQVGCVGTPAIGV